MLTISVGHHVHGQYKSAAFSMGDGQSEQTVSMARTFTTDEDIPLTLPSSVYNFSISGNAMLKDTTNSLIRITLVDNYEMEHLVYEIYPLLTDRWRFDFDHMAFETSGMDGIHVTGMKIRILNAELTLGEYHYTTEPTRSIQRQQRFKSQQQYIIETLNANLEARNMPWRAGETSVSNLSYEEKKNLFGGTVPNLNGFEYYIGGIFVMPGYQPEQVAQSQEAQEVQATAAVPSSWDWRNKDGKNWMTPVKSQGSCGSCWAFATLGALEAYVNIYFQQLVNFDLSEQDLISCYHGTGCSGGNAPDAYNYIINHGVVDENCFPYMESNGNCSNKCNTSNETVKVQTCIVFNSATQTENDLKELVAKGPASFSISSWGHAMALAGYKTIQKGDKIYVSTTDYIIIGANSSLIGSTAWLLKNSWGANFGDNGYAYIMVDISNTRNIVAPKGEIELSYLNVESTVYWNRDQTIDKTIYIKQGGTLYVTATIGMGSTKKIIVRNGGKLVIDGGVLNNAFIEVESGGQLQIINNGTIKLRNAAALDVKKGGTLDINYGYID